jgi:hypothetical protein
LLVWEREEIQALPPGSRREETFGHPGEKRLPDAQLKTLAERVSFPGAAGVIYRSIVVIEILLQRKINAER